MQLNILDQCPPGTYNSTTGLEPCSRCPEYHYSLQYGSTQCLLRNDSIAESITTQKESTSSSIAIGNLNTNFFISIILNF